MVKILIVSFLFCFISCDKQQKDLKIKDQKHDHVETYYTCSMHPQIKEDGPGKCPICHMNLTKVTVDRSELESKSQAKKENIIIKEQWRCKDFPEVTSMQKDICPLDGTKMVKVDFASKIVAEIKLRESQLGHFKPTYFPVTTMKMQKDIRLLGSVFQSEEKESSIPARVSGRVEKVYIKSTGSLVGLGDPVVDFYSPKLITAGEEYLVARSTYSNNKSKEFKDLLEQSKERLIQWGVKPLQFKAWFEKNKVPKNITLYSPSTGIVRKKHAQNGKYFKEGEDFFELSDLSDVWVEMDVYEQDVNLISLGQKVKMEFIAIPGEIYTGEIDFIDPVLDRTSRTLKVRTTVKNKSGQLKPGMVADVHLNVKFDGLYLVVPRTAIIDTGKRKVVWLKVSDKKFKAHTVLTGIESQGYVEIKDGLNKDDQVVMDGNFLIDAQAQLFGGYKD